MSRMQRLFVLVLAVAVWAVGLGAAIFSAERPTGSVAGRVAAQDGTPLAGARVFLYGENGRSRVVQTADDGTFRADRLPVEIWRLQARKRGYDAQWLEPEIKIEESQTHKDADFALMPREATVNFAHYQRVFLPKEKLRIATRGSLVESLDMELYRLDMGAVLKQRGNLSDLTTWETVAAKPANFAAAHSANPAIGPDLPPAIPAAAVSPLATWSALIPAGAVDEDDWFYRPVEVPAQPEGTYLVTLHARTEKGRVLRDAYWFNVTRLALVTKRTTDQVLVYATDFETKKPLPGTEIQVHLGPVLTASGRTGPDGLWRAQVSQEGQYITITGRSGASFANVSAYHGHSDRLAVYTYTDRPIYRPGHRVQFKGIVRNNRTATPRLPGVSQAVIAVKDSDGGEVFRRDLPVNDLGTYNGDFVIPDDGHTGNYSLITEIGDDRYYTYFEVQAYRKPEFKVDVKPARPRVVGGETQAVGVNATYYFGAPVAGAKVRYTVFSKPDYPGWTEEDTFYGGYSGDHEPMGGEVVTEGESVTDEAGHFDIAIATRKIASTGPHVATYDQRYIVEIESQDQSRRLVKGKATFMVTRGRFNLEAAVSTYLVRTGEPVRVGIEAHDYEGKPVRTPVVVKLEREVYIPPKSDEGYGTTRYEDAGSQTVETGTDGKAYAMIKAPQAGSFVVNVTAKDASANEISSQAWFWASAEETAQTDSYGSLGVTFDKKAYRPGETARILITSPVPNLPVLVTIEGDRIHEARMLTLQGSNVRLEVPVKAAYQPNVFVAASMVNGRELLTSERSLNVMPVERFLDVVVEPSKERYLPGEVASFKVKTMGAGGKPVAGAEVSLGIVDEAIYALAPDRTPDIRRFFLGPRSSDVSTFHSFGTEYSGGPAKDLGDVKVRRNFQDTAAWYPALRTGGDGTAEVTFTLPDNLTTWVCTARAITADTRAGSTVRNVLATKDLLVRLETPRFFTQGDTLHLAAIVHNFTDKAQDVQTMLNPGSLKLDGSNRRTATIKPGGAELADFPVTVTTPGTTSVEVVAGNRAANDGMALELPVLPHGLPEAGTWAGEVKPDAKVAFEVPRTAVAQTVRLAVTVTPSPWAALLAGIDYLAQYPYWCTEQTTSRIVPMALVYMQLPGDDPRRVQLGTDVGTATRKLLGLQHETGWGWWESGDSEVEMTAYALWGLTAARAAGFEVPDHRVGRGLSYLAATLPRITRDTPRRHVIEHGSGPDTRAVGIWGMTQALADGQPGALEMPSGALDLRSGTKGGAASADQIRAWSRTLDAEFDRLWADRKNLTTYGRSVLAEAMGRVGHPRAARILADLDAEAKQSETMAHWEAGGTFAWWNNDVETTSHAVLAYLYTDPQNPLVAKAERWLEMNRKGSRWMSTKDTSAALAAIAGFARSRDQAVASPYPVEMTLDGAPLTMAIADPGPGGKPLEVVIKGDRLPAGKHELTIVAKGSSAPLFGAELRYFRQTGEIPAKPGKVIQVERSYHAIPPDLQAEARTMTLSQLFSAKVFPRLAPVKGRAKPGDRIVVRIRVKTTQDVRYAVVEDPLPAGSEVLSDESGESYWWNHRDILDDKVVFFADTLAKGNPHDFFYVIRPEIVGDFHILPTRTEAMYAPDVRAYGAEDRLQVRE